MIWVILAKVFYVSVDIFKSFNSLIRVYNVVVQVLDFSEILNRIVIQKFQTQNYLYVDSYKLP